MPLFNPLPNCPPKKHNCNKQSLKTNVAPEDIMDYCKKAVESEKPMEIKVDEEARRIDAVFRIAVFGFKDDCTLLVYPAHNGCIIHMRSASRVGDYDFGVNRRRLNRIRSRLYRMTLEK